MYYILCKCQDHERLEETQMKKFLLLQVGEKMNDKYVTGTYFTK